MRSKAGTAWLLCLLMTACERGGGRPEAASDAPSAESAQPGRQEPQRQIAWWVTARFVPEDTTVLGLSLAAIDSSWVKATVLRDHLMPAAAESDRSLLDSAGVGFLLRGDFNSNGLEEQAAVGVFENASGLTGVFLTIIERESGGVWKKLATFTQVGAPGFVVLRLREDGSLTWSDCMECDGWMGVRWTGREYEIED
jgi:hypothetical protein